MHEATGRVAGIAVRTARKGPMREVNSATAPADGWLDADVKSTADRGITFISREQWREVVAELGADLPWHTRRANVLTEGLRLGDLIGKVVRVGTLEVQINGETEPCGYMDQLHAGLKDTLGPECRGGVYGRVSKPGTFSVGDSICIVG
jgi:MOSC domain-containing protein YiiM